jgi:Fe-Mn family superoxide dismutase
MAHKIKPLSCDPSRVRGMSERMIISHYENNYGGAVKHLNLIEEELAELDYGKAAGFVINGLKREQLIAMNSMILHEMFFGGLGEPSEPDPTLHEALTRDFGSIERWQTEFVAMAKSLGGGSSWVLLSWSPIGRLVNQWAADDCHTPPEACRSWLSICMSTPITWITARKPPTTLAPSWRRSTGPRFDGLRMGSGTELERSARSRRTSSCASNFGPSFRY